MGHVIVIGAGQAGSSCVAKLRNSGFDGQVTLIGAEPVPPYQRPPLSKAYLMGDMALERLYLRPEAFYAEQDIDLRLGATVDAIDVSAQQITVDGARSCYDTCVEDHPHFYWEDEGRLTDAPAGSVSFADLPAPPPGAKIARVDVVIRLRRG